MNHGIRRAVFVPYLNRCGTRMWAPPTSLGRRNMYSDAAPAMILVPSALVHHYYLQGSSLPDYDTFTLCTHSSLPHGTEQMEGAASSPAMVQQRSSLLRGNLRVLASLRFRSGHQMVFQRRLVLQSCAGGTVCKAFSNELEPVNGFSLSATVDALAEETQDLVPPMLNAGTSGTETFFTATADSAIIPEDAAQTPPIPTLGPELNDASFPTFATSYAGARTRTTMKLDRECIPSLDSSYADAHQGSMPSRADTITETPCIPKTSEATKLQRSVRVLHFLALSKKNRPRRGLKRGRHPLNKDASSVLHQAVLMIAGNEGCCPQHPVDAPPPPSTIPTSEQDTMMYHQPLEVQQALGVHWCYPIHYYCHACGFREDDVAQAVSLHRAHTPEGSNLSSSNTLNVTQRCRVCGASPTSCG